MLSPGTVSFMIGLTLLMLGITDQGARPIVTVAMQNGILPWILVAAIAIYFVALLIRILIDLWQEKAFRE